MLQRPLIDQRDVEAMLRSNISMKKPGRLFGNPAAFITLECCMCNVEWNSHYTFHFQHSTAL